MRRLLMSVLGASLMASGAGVQAQTGGTGMQAQTSGTAGAPVLPTAPTTKVLAMGHLMVPQSGARGVLPQEVRETLKLYLGGKIDQWWVRQDGKGVVFLMNVTTVEEARAILEKLPMRQANPKVMEFELIPLGPLTPLSILLREPGGGVTP